MNLRQKIQQQNIKVYKVGNCLFQEPIQKILSSYDQNCISIFKKRLQLQTLIIRSATDLLSKQQFWKTWRLLLQKIILCDMKSISASYSSLNKKILKQMKHIQFDQLICLELNSNHFNNVQLLYLIKAPKLRQISLKNNRISKFKTFQKCKFPCLKIMNLSDNTFINLTSLRTMHFVQLKQIVQESFNNYHKTNDLSCLLRLQSKKIKQIKTLFINEIDQKNILGMIRKKCIQ